MLRLRNPYITTCDLPERHLQVKESSSAALSIRDVAHMAGTSTATVSRVISGRGYVSPGLTDRVTKAVRESNFVVNPEASRRRRRPRAAGLMHGVVAVAFCGVGRQEIMGYYGAELLEAVHEAAVNADVMVTTWFLNARDLDAGIVSAHLSRHRVDGILLKPLPGFDHAVFAKIAPTVEISVRDRDNASFPVVEVDNDKGIAALVRRLVELGHRRVEFMTLRSIHPSFMDRAASFRKAMAEHGLKPDVYEAPGQDFVDYAAQYAARSAAERPTAFVAVSDNRAFALMRDLARHGVRVPADASVVGFDGFSIGAEIHPALTSWRPHWPDIGRTGFALLLELAAGRSVPTRTLIGGELVTRESAGAPPESARTLSESGEAG